MSRNATCPSDSVAPSPDPRLNELRAELHALLRVGPLMPVTKAALEVDGHEPSSRNVLRQAVHGSGGWKLPTLRGPRRSRTTTTACYRRWRELSSGTDCAPTAASAHPPAAAAPAARRDAVDDAVLSSFGLSRRQRGAK